VRIEEDGKTPIVEEELVSQMRSIISAGYEPVSATLSVRSPIRKPKNI
jgi:hypothetical protein